MHLLWDRMFGTGEYTYRRKCAERAAAREAKAAEMRAMDELDSEEIKGSASGGESRAAAVKSSEMPSEDGDCRSRVQVGGA
jgi:hypothetical protein